MIQINENYRLDSDQWNVILQKRKMRENKKTKKVSEVWENEGYYPDYQSALDGLLKREIHETAKLEKIIKKINEYKALVNKIFKGIKIIKQGESEDK